MAMSDKEEPEALEELDEATIEAIKQGLEAENSGHFVTLEEAVQFARERRGQWQKTPRAGA